MREENRAGWKVVWQCLTKRNIILPCNPGIMLPGIFSKQLKTHVHIKCEHRDVYSNIIHNCQNLEATKMSSVGKWINKLWYVQTMEYYSKLKRSEISSHEKTWKNLKCVLIHENSQSKKATYYVSIYMTL